VIRKHFGGDDITQLFYRLIKSERALHYFPQNLLYPMQYPYHFMLMERVKESLGTLLMNEQKVDLVKVVHLWIKEQNGEEIPNRPSNNSKVSSSTQATFNCSDALMVAPQSLFYSQLLQI